MKFLDDEPDYILLGRKEHKTHAVRNASFSKEEAVCGSYTQYHNKMNNLLLGPFPIDCKNCLKIRKQLGYWP